MGIEPTYLAWKASVLPLNYTRMFLIEKCETILFGTGETLLDGSVCPEPESNQRHEDFQSSALPTELSGHLSSGDRI